MPHAIPMPAPPLSPGRWRRLLELFGACSQAPVQYRERLLTQLCPDDPEIRARAAAMIRAIEVNPEFMAEPAPGSPAGHP